MSQYRLVGLPRFSAFGRVVEGVDLNKQVAESTVAAIKRDLHEHRLLVFRGQGRVSGERQVEISRWWGPVESTFAKHPRSPDPDVFRVSNDPREGCTSVGRSGWHIDGTFMEKPFKVQTMHFWSVLSANHGGNTLFAPLKEVAEHLLRRDHDNDNDDRFSWKDLYFVTNRRTDYALAHPILCKHPETGDFTCVFHLGPHFMDALVEGKRTLSAVEQKKVCDILRRACENEEWCLSMEWREGDFALVDNLALAHYAHPSTQGGREQCGLRILHRTTVAGEHRPSK